MSLRIRKLELRIVTPSGLFGVRLSFDTGLVILRADNSKGKSTCVQAILYGLGLEGMLSPEHKIPLPHVMTQYVDDDDGQAHNVVESSVLLEIENSDGNVLSLQRAIVSESIDKKLIRVWKGPKLSQPDNSFEQYDTFVRMGGAATRPRGFHTELGNFLGWELPKVPRYQAEPCILYLETVFPLLVIEQKHGWSGIQSRMPTHFRIRDVSRRSTEFFARSRCLQERYRAGAA